MRWARIYTVQQSAVAQVPRNVSYQGVIINEGQPATGVFKVTVNYYTSTSNTPLFSETFTGVQVNNGVFDLILGSSSGGFPASMTFAEPYFIGVQVNDGAELQPRTPMLSVPYAINAASVGGFTASSTPQAGGLLVLDQQGMIPANLLPQTRNVNIVGGSNITVNLDSTNNTFTISSEVKRGITGVIAGEGLIGGGLDGDVTLALAPGAITTDRIAPSAVTGSRPDPNIAGEGLFQDVLGNLNVGVDGTTIRVINDRLTLGTIGNVNTDSTIQTRITGTAPAGSFITGVNQNGTVSTASITGDNSLTRTLNGNNVVFGINPANSNVFTAGQTFTGGITTSDITTVGNITQTGGHGKL